MDFVNIYDLEQVETNRYIGRNNVAFNWSIVYGGQIMAQSIVAALHTVQDYYFHSLQVYFLRPGRLNQTLLYQVKNLRDGRTICHRLVQVFQGNEVLAEIILSFCKLNVQGISAQNVQMPSVLPSCDLLPFEDVIRSHLPQHIRERLLGDYQSYFPFKTYHCEPSFKLDPNLMAFERYYWFELKEEQKYLDVNPSPLLAYLSDFHFLSTSCQNLDDHGISLDIATVSHSIYLHRKFSYKMKHLFHMRCVDSSHGFSTIEGRIFNEKGDFVASIVQEGVTRFE